MEDNSLSRRRFLQTSAVLTGAAVLASAGAAAWGADAAKRTAADQVELGKTGVRLSRLGIGTGSSNGHVQTAQGKDAFTKLIQHAYDHGITYIDSADDYATFDWIADAIKGLPREKLFIQSKITGVPEDAMKEIDRQRSVFKTDYVDSVLVHCMTRQGWTDEWKRAMEGFDAAKEKKWIRAKGVSCHTLPALVEANKTDFPDVHLVRVNPMGQFMDGHRDGAGGVDVKPVLDEIQAMHEKGRGVIGMKIIGNGTFRDPAQREKSIRFAMNNPNIDAIVIGMKSTAEIDENIAMINKALAA